MHQAVLDIGVYRLGLGFGFRLRCRLGLRLGFRIRCRLGLRLRCRLGLRFSHYGRLGGRFGLRLGYRCLDLHPVVLSEGVPTGLGQTVGLTGIQVILTPDSMLGLVDIVNTAILILNQTGIDGLAVYIVADVAVLVMHQAVLDIGVYRFGFRLRCRFGLRFSHYGRLGGR